MKRSIIAFLASLMILSCHSQDCSTLPQKFSSYKQAIELVQNSRFVFTDEANTSSSSWISSASYYSCDGKTGYLVYSTNSGKEYIHQGVPINIWRGFKNAASKGSFYNANIKNRFQLKIRFWELSFLTDQIEANYCLSPSTYRTSSISVLSSL